MSQLGYKHQVGELRSDVDPEIADLVGVRVLELAQFIKRQLGGRSGQRIVNRDVYELIEVCLRAGNGSGQFGQLSTGVRDRNKIGIDAAHRADQLGHVKACSLLLHPPPTRLVGDSQSAVCQAIKQLGG